MRKSLMFLMLMLLAPALLLGQAITTGQINGMVSDEDGNPIADADVEVTNTDTGLARSAKTGENGKFLFGVLPVGNYTVLAQAVGMQPQVYSFRLGVGETVPVDVTLLPGEVITEEIAVYSTATALQTTAAGENFDYRETVEELPLISRDPEDVAMLSANVSPNGPHTNNARSAAGGGYSVSGAMTTETVVMLDGAEVSDPYFGGAPVLYLEDAIEEVQVLTSGISARYGRFQGGVINAITKSGSNQYEATVRLELSNEDWNSTSPFGETQADDVQETYQATVGGYVLKDKLWFFGGAREIPDSTRARTTSATQETVNQMDAENRWQLKFRGAPAANHIFDISHLEFSSEQSNRSGLTAGEARSHNGVRTDDRETDSISYQGVLTPTLFLEVQATKKDVQLASGGDPNGGDPIFDFARGEVFNNHWWDFTDPSVRDNETISAHVTQALDTEKFGIHTIEAGVQQLTSTTGGENRQSSTGFNYLALNPDFFVGQTNGVSTFNVRSFGAVRWEALALGGDQELENTAAYIQDTIDVGKWRFDIGFRYDEYDGAGPLPTFNINLDDVAPRLGVTYNLSQNWQVLATWGKYVARINDGTVNNATGVSSAPRIETFYTGPDFENVTGVQIGEILRNDAFWTIITDFVDPTQPTNLLADDLTAPFAEDLTFSIRHALANNAGSLMFQYVNREFRGIIDDFVGGACDFGLAFSGCPASNFTDVVDPGGNAATVDTVVWANTSRARREYEAISLQWDIRPGRNWGIGGNYTFGENQGNHEGEGQNQPGAGTEIGDFVRSRPEEAAVPFGLTDEDVTHRASIWGTYRLSLERAGNLSFSGIYNYSSGGTYNLTADVAYADDPLYLTDSGTYDHFFANRGGQRFNEFWSADASVRYEVPLVSRLKLWVKLTAMNVLNSDTLTSFNTSGGATTVNGILQFAPAGNCGLSDSPSRDCTGFNQIRSERDYQIPREWFVTVGLRF